MVVATLPSVGYSGKTLPDKLGYKPGSVAAFIEVPEELTALSSSVPFGSRAPPGLGAAAAAGEFDLSTPSPRAMPRSCRTSRACNGR